MGDFRVKKTTKCRNKRHNKGKFQGKEWASDFFKFAVAFTTYEFLAQEAKDSNNNKKIA